MTKIRLLTQDESISVVHGMPREAAGHGAAQQILRLGELAPRLVSLPGAEMELLP